VIALLIPSMPDVEAALDFVERQGAVIRVTLVLGNDGGVRGVALIRRRA